MKTTRSLLIALATMSFAACSSENTLGPASANDDQSFNALQGSSGLGLAATVRVRCELRSGQRSRISLDGNDLTPLGGRWSGVVRSGTNVAAAPMRSAVGDEVEFDFDSNPADVRAGATAIAANFITVGPGADVTAQILNAAGAVVAAGSADCQTR